MAEPDPQAEPPASVVRASPHLWGRSVTSRSPAPQKPPPDIKHLKHVYLSRMGSPELNAIENPKPVARPVPLADEFSDLILLPESDDIDGATDDIQLPRRPSLLGEVAQRQVSPVQEQSINSKGKEPVAQQGPSLPKPKVIIHLIRSAESWGDLLTNSHDPRFDREKCSGKDPVLTPKGIQQTKILGRSFEPMDRIVYCLCSPLARALMTALLGFQDLAKRNIKLVAWAELREHGDRPANEGSNLGLLQEWERKWNGEPNRLKLDFSILKENWEKHSGRGEDVLSMRAARIRKQLYAIGEKFKKEKWGHSGDRPFPKRSVMTPDIEILVIGHRNIFVAMDGSDDHDFFGMCKSYEFASEEMITAGASKYALVETEKSKARQRHIGKQRQSLQESGQLGKVNFRYQLREGSATQMDWTEDKTPGDGPFPEDLDSITWSADGRNDEFSWLNPIPVEYINTGMRNGEGSSNYPVLLDGAVPGENVGAGQGEDSTDSLFHFEKKNLEALKARVYDSVPVTTYADPSAVIQAEGKAREERDRYMFWPPKTDRRQN